MKLALSFFAFVITVFCSCQNTNNQNVEQKNYETDLINREKTSGEKQYQNAGQPIGNYSFEVKTTEPDFENGIIPWASIEKPDIENLIDKDKIIVTDKSVTIVVDYPLKQEFVFTVDSKDGFSRAILLKEISRIYHKVYQEEEKTATVKTLSMEKRTMANRNETNGKYGIWGHDIGDLVLTDIDVYKTAGNKIILVLNIDS